MPQEAHGSSCPLIPSSFQGHMAERREQSDQEEPLQGAQCPALALHRPREGRRGELSLAQG